MFQHVLCLVMIYAVRKENNCFYTLYIWGMLKVEDKLHFRGLLPRANKVISMLERHANEKEREWKNSEWHMNKYHCIYMLQTQRLNDNSNYNTVWELSVNIWKSISTPNTCDQFPRKHEK